MWASLIDHRRPRSPSAITELEFGLAFDFVARGKFDPFYFRDRFCQPSVTDQRPLRTSSAIPRWSTERQNSSRTPRMRMVSRGRRRHSPVF
jgi:hypothetical protein